MFHTEQLGSCARSTLVFVRRLVQLSDCIPTVLRFLVLLGSYKQILWQYLKLYHDRFLQQPVQFIYSLNPLTGQAAVGVTWTSCSRSYLDKLQSELLRQAAVGVTWTSCSRSYLDKLQSELLRQAAVGVTVSIMTNAQHVGAPGRLITWGPLKPTFFKIYLPRTAPANIFEGACPNCG